MHLFLNLRATKTLRLNGKCSKEADILDCVADLDFLDDNFEDLLDGIKRQEQQILVMDKHMLRELYSDKATTLKTGTRDAIMIKDEEDEHFVPQADATPKRQAGDESAVKPAKKHRKTTNDVRMVDAPDPGDHAAGEMMRGGMGGAMGGGGMSGGMGGSMSGGMGQGMSGGMSGGMGGGMFNQPMGAWGGNGWPGMGGHVHGRGGNTGGAWAGDNSLGSRSVLNAPSACPVRPKKSGPLDEDDDEE